MPLGHIALAGLAGTILMSLAMGAIHRARLANADMIRAIGSMATGSLKNSFPAGLLIHLTVGALFALPYTYILRTLPVQSPFALIGAGAALGTFHGAAMSFVLLALVADRHPVEQFRDCGFEVAAAHLVGHVVYGAGLGFMCSQIGA